MHNHNMRPVIGLTAYVERARWGGWEDIATLLPHRYVEQLQAAGAQAVLIPPDLGADSADLLGRLDGLLLTGGADIDPARYGAARSPATVDVRPDRDASELALLTGALTAQMPVLGICRGMQLMTVASGGVLHQHLPDVVGHHRHRPGVRTFGEHRLRVAPASRLASILPGEVTVWSHHHQGVADTGTALATGWAPDGSIEAVEVPGHPFALGVLWHPEVSDDKRLFTALIAAAGGRAQ